MNSNNILNNVISIDHQKCTGCQRCIPVCPVDNIIIKQKKALPVNESCLLCDHCAATCPEGAIDNPKADDSTLMFNSFELKREWMPPGQFDPAQLAHLMYSRRSCRNFGPKELCAEQLDDLIKFGISAPSGTNSQLWTFTLLNTREKVVALAEVVLAYYQKLNKLAANTLLRKSLSVIGNRELEIYFRDYHESVEDAISRWKGQQEDLLFHGAPAVIVVGNKTHASCPREDPLLATQNILLGAHSLGLGSCLIGFVVEAAKRDKSIAGHLKIPSDERIYSVIALGYSQERYSGLPRRNKPLIRR
ncbi:MAG: 4Fe-4S binding protein [Bdellovibrionales bacterium]|jgi:nitroreductase/NAD-dependent dihydropyrimidine dehydrogenase PreA subunit|nr:4Fe-4S binding protein [Bdellovibrionales bacterium]MBT3524878.1 4Fe-4S binding protein [Bdellovibrionales bacterium]MBT7767512.1 4Fe-4S binding protein [Bdellovibrionales bacterium]